MPGVFSSVIVHNERLAEAVYSISILCPDIADTARAGQFLNIKCGAERLLRRPISICCIDGGKVKFVFEVKGAGTDWLAKRAAGQILDVMGPLGNGFSVPDDSFVVVGGGMGVPPLLYAAMSAKRGLDAVLGFRSADRVILYNDFMSVCGKVIVSTDDGSRGIMGTVVQPLAELLKGGGYGCVLACGPRVMLSAVAGICKQFGIPCQVSLEERMGCGVGACLVCACATTEGGAAKMSRVCKDGPVFDAREVVWEEAGTE